MGIRASRGSCIGPWRKAVSTLAALVLASGCAGIPFDRPKPYSESFLDTADTRIGRAVEGWTEAHGGRSGFYPLSAGLDALGVRLRIAEQAERSLDLQYFLMKPDTAGAVMVGALLRAADRGVRVRFLLDDVFTTTTDRTLLLLNEHPNIEVRLFNPVSRRGIASLNFLLDFKRANRRMHNKSFTADNQVTVVGGRNIADEYFQLKDDVLFADFDVLALGPVVTDVSESFDRFWNHSRAVPIDYVSRLREGESLEQVRAEVGRELDDAHDTIYARALDSTLLQEVISGQRPLFSGEAEVLSDEPDKLVQAVDAEHMRLARSLAEVLRCAEREVLLISPYYVPMDDGVELARELVDQGLQVVVITNSLASNNHVPVHSGYSSYRRPVLRAGVELYEVRVDAPRESAGGEDGPNRLTLHTKAYFIDRRYLLVGSLNLDPRSIEINAEMGVLIDCEELVAPLVDEIMRELPNFAYRVRENEQGKLEWRGRIDGQDVMETKEPQASCWRRFKAWFLRIVPDRQL